ncbi:MULTISPECIES: histidine phosphatase family protein [unclassified Spirosoma]|uniref:histidine phosphatase family protein n=1 Tax=unclassified Spirosoma TaxID=2621999 RepID=UPI00095EF0E7|nr:MULTISPECIES: histidine phosphatase family protein [unclassified Spirosoma]MBN8820918.1 histidine phosphatase family protein [Spirosoma sp.]OJW76031.1 MAG: histidine phosphatase family protein [Spirosoma sp. 48-14]
MTQKTIYLIRHGETDFNRRGIVQGSGVDADLNEMGRAQAMAFFLAYQHVPFQKIYISGLKRTYQTAEPFIELGIPYEKLTGLNEISWGIMEGKAPGNLDNEYYRALIEAWESGRTDQPTEGGESPDQVAARQKEAIDVILSHPDEETVLVAMHGRAMRILLSWITNQPLSHMDQFEHSNVCLYKLLYDYESTTFTITQANDTAHLLSLALTQ